MKVMGTMQRMSRGLAGALLPLVLGVSPAHASDELHFAFWGARAADGEVVVRQMVPFDQSLGYGFEPAGATFNKDDTCNRPPIKIAGTDQATRFSVAVPPGAYMVDMQFRRPVDGPVGAEARRYYYLSGFESKRTRTLRAVVDVHNPIIAKKPTSPSGDYAVLLKPGECGSYTWDNKLTLVYYGDVKALAHIDIKPVSAHRVFLLGDSTVVDQQEAPYAAWGQMLPLFLSSDIIIANYAESGETLKAFLAQRRLDKVLHVSQPGDIALIQFSHNDEKEHLQPNSAPDINTFPLYLRVFVAELRRKGIQPVLVTPMERLFFDPLGKIVETHGNYPQMIREVAQSEKVPLIDLNAMSKKLYEALGPAAAKSAFAGGEGVDTTHQSVFGAFELARCVVEAVRAQDLPLAKYIKSELASFNPQQPDKPSIVEQ